MTINGIQAGIMEANGEGRFKQVNAKIEFRTNDGHLVTFWHCRTTKDAAQQIRIFRNAQKWVMPS